MNSMTAPITLDESRRLIALEATKNFPRTARN